MNTMKKPFRSRFNTRLEYDEAMSRYNQVMQHLTKGAPRGVSQMEVSTDSHGK